MWHQHIMYVMTAVKYIHATQENNFPWKKVWKIQQPFRYAVWQEGACPMLVMHTQIATGEGQTCIYLDGQPIYQQTTQEICWSWCEVGNLTWPRELDFLVEDSVWMCLFQIKQAPLRCEVAELSWAELSPPALAAHFHCTHTAWALWAGQWGQSRTLTPCCCLLIITIITQPQLQEHHAWEEGAEVLLSSVVMLKYLKWGTPQCSECERWNTQTVWKCGLLSLNTVCCKHGWIFIHVAEAGLPCKCILKVFHLPNPSCTSDNLQYYFFC